MATEHQRTPVPGPAFVRLLARITGEEIPAPGPPVAARLGQWVDWNRAVALSAALDGRLPAAADGIPDTAGIEPDGEAGACARARRALEDAIAARGPGGHRAPASDATPDFAPYRRDYLDLQRSMQATTGQLRGRLRDALASRPGDAARLAEVDAVMEQTLSPREQALLATVPALLGAHFERLRAAADAAPDQSPGDWRARFHHDMQRVLRAELDVRFHPIDGLLAALRP